MGAGAAAVASIGLGVAGIREQREARKEAQRANRAQQRAAAVRNARARRQSIAQARSMQAQTANQAAIMGISGSSVSEGIQASVQSQLNSNLSFQQQLESLDRTRFEAQRNIQEANQRASMFSTLSQFAGSPASTKVFSAIGNIGNSAQGVSAANRNIQRFSNVTSPNTRVG